MAEVRIADNSERGKVLNATTPALNVAYLEFGAEAAPPVVLLHGWPYDVHCYDEVAPRLASSGYRAIVPYLRGFGPITYRSDSLMRSGPQAALGKDVVDLLDALGIQAATLVGYDWGGRAACVAAALLSTLTLFGSGTLLVQACSNY
jgi:pimeloyl-ACP methyl ester carboxylesterase